MDRSDFDWYGYFAALTTPFTQDGALDLAAFGDTIRCYIEQGVHGLLVNGSTGEWAAQSPAERRQLAEAAVTAADGRVPVIIAVTHPRQDTAVELAQHAEAVGADSIMIPPPPGVRPDPRELLGYYEVLTSSTALPVWLYNFPQENATEMSIGLIRDLVQLPNVVAVKQSTPDERRLFATIEAVGDTTLVFGHLLSRLGLAAISGGFGGDGHFGSGMPLGSRMPRFFELARAGETARASEIADDFSTFTDRLKGSDSDGYNWRFGGMQASLKTVMNLQGQPGGYPRKPKLPITDPLSLQRISETLRELDLPVKA